MKKVLAVMWSSYLPPLVEAAKEQNLFALKAYSTKSLTDQETFEKFLLSAQKASAIVLYRAAEDYWPELEEQIKTHAPRAKVVWTGYEASFWPLSAGGAEVGATVYRYLLYGGPENYTQLVRYLAARVLEKEIAYKPPQELPWEGIYHPRAPKVFSSTEEYLSWYNPPDKAPLVGILFSRQYWVNNDLDVENALISALEEKGLFVIPVFAYSLADSALGAKGSAWAVENFFFDHKKQPLIQALVKLQPFLLGAERRSPSDSELAAKGVELLKKLNVPVFQPVTMYYQDEDQWRKNPQGLTSEIGWSIALPEAEGVIEPLAIAAMKRWQDEKTSISLEKRAPLMERCQRLASRVAAWVRLRQTPPAERKVVFVLHNNPCASVEATVGAGANLDSLESVVRLLKRLKKEGYLVEDIPPDGKALARLILERKAVSEFRWTTVEEIVAKGGALAKVSLEQYLRWWRELSPYVRERMEKAWGTPPGEEKDGVPPAMVHQGEIVITGLKFGNVVVCVQPKRGCAGPRCDGRVCKILHDPDIPPPHQYLATYRYLEEIFGAHVIVHVGTHGNLEFLPGKGVALSEACFPDLAIHRLPHLYIYNADNPPEGTIAKRRAYAVLVDHMQTVMQESGLYGELEELAQLLEEYERAAYGDPARAHMLEHLISELLEKTNLKPEVEKALKNSPEKGFKALVRAAHEVLTRLRESHIQDGLHIFGEVPRGERLAKFIKAILRYDLREKKDWEPFFNDESIWQAISQEKDLALKQDGQGLGEFLARIADLKERILASREIEALLNGLSGGYIPAGPSGLITRGRDDVLPTGRNFFSIDPRRVPTKAAYQVGLRLAEAVVQKYLREKGTYPENVAFYWMANDIMWADGEGMAQILALLGVRPVWAPSGRIKGLEVIPLHELSRPRIDVTIRVSGITRDNFPECISWVDKAVQMVALLDEPPEKNFVRKHTLERLHLLSQDTNDPKALRRATFRIFASKPGTYKAGVNLAVYASAWKEERDLAEIFVYWNGYAYGEGVFGEEAHGELAESLKRVSLTFNKTVTDEYDLFGCCSYFGTHGGLTIAARELSGQEVPAYYGDTRDPTAIEVRDLADEIKRVVRTKLLNPKWIEGMKRHGYRGAGEIAKRLGRVYGWQATTRAVEDWVFDELARTYVLDEENRRFFQKENPYALEEIARRLLEAEARGLWKPAPDVQKGLREVYLEIEGQLEGETGPSHGSFQGGAVDIITSEEVEAWQQEISRVKEFFTPKEKDHALG